MVDQEGYTYYNWATANKETGVALTAMGNETRYVYVWDVWHCDSQMIVQDRPNYVVWAWDNWKQKQFTTNNGTGIYLNDDTGKYDVKDVVEESNRLLKLKSFWSSLYCPDFFILPICFSLRWHALWRSFQTSKKFDQLNEPIRKNTVKKVRYRLYARRQNHYLNIVNHIVRVLFVLFWVVSELICN